MKWKFIKGYRNYLINEFGLVYSKKTDKFLKPSVMLNGVLWTCLSNKGVSKNFMLSSLVLDHFQPSQTSINVFAFHDDLEVRNCANDNLTRCTRSDRMRMFNEIKGKKRGVYKWTNGKTDKHGNPYIRFRIIIKDQSGKAKTIGYYKTEFFARFKYIQAYKKMYGRFPY